MKRAVFPKVVTVLSLTGISSKRKEVILLFYPALLRPHLEFWAQFWALGYERDMDILRIFPQRTTKMIKRWEHLSSEGRLREVGLFSPEKRRSHQCVQIPERKVQRGQSQAPLGGAQSQNKMLWKIGCSL